MYKFFMFFVISTSLSFLFSITTNSIHYMLTIYK